MIPAASDVAAPTRVPGEADVVVVGSGPAGCSAARAVAEYAPQEPDWDNRVRFDTGGTDAFGLPQPHIEFRERQDDHRRRAAALRGHEVADLRGSQN
jgi:choline dehydrogenase-like flavoprotein